MFRDNPAYVRCVRLLIDLHLLMKEGKDETAEGDRIRDEMDECWPALSEAEVERINGMSADLYTLEPDSPIRHPEDGGIRSEEARETLQSLLGRNAWQEILEYLRANSSQIPAGTAAYYRGGCWLQLEEIEAAILFLHFAAEKDDAFAPALVKSLADSGHADEAVLELERLLKTVQDQPARNLLLLADACCLLAAVDHAEILWLERVVRSFEAVLSALKLNKLEPDDRKWSASSYANLAICYELLGAQTSALRACEKALQLNPDEPYGLTLHDLLLGGRPATAENLGESVRDVQRRFFADASMSQHPSFLSLESVA